MGCDHESRLSRVSRQMLIVSLAITVAFTVACFVVLGGDVFHWTPTLSTFPF